MTTTRLMHALLLAAALGAPARMAAAADPPATGAAPAAPPDSVVVMIGNRLFPDFLEVISTGMREKRQIGDTDFFFEVRAFFPHFSIIDSTKAIVSLSDEPENPAFRIMVFENDAAIDSTWAFFKLSIPHFTRKSALWFQVIEFEYRGQVYRKQAENAAPPGQAPHPVPANGSNKKEHP